MEIVAVVAGEAIINIVGRVIGVMKDVIEKEDNCQILHTDLKRMENLLLDITTLFKDQQKEAPETLKNWLQRLENSLTEANSLLDRSSQPVRCLDCLICNPVRLSKEIKAWKVTFDNLFQGLQNDLSTFVSAQQIAKSAPQKALLQDVPPSGFVGSGIDSAKAQVEMWLTETDDVHTIGVWGMAGVGKTSFLKVVYNHYIEVTNVFQHVIWVTVSADYKVLDLQARIAKAINLDYVIHVLDLLQMWISEGLVRSKQGSHFMDMAIGRSYVNLLVDRCLFQNVSGDENIYNGWEVLDGHRQSIRVHDCLRDMAIYIGEKDENCVFKAGQQLQNFPEIQNEDCKRISVSYTEIQNLPTLFTRPKLVSLFLNSIPIEEVASGFLVSLTSLKVLNLSNSRISSIPSSVGELKQLEFLNLSGLEGIQDLPAEICHLSSFNSWIFQGVAIYSHCHLRLESLKLSSILI